MTFVLPSTTVTVDGEKLTKYIFTDATVMQAAKDVIAKRAGWSDIIHNRKGKWHYYGITPVGQTADESVMDDGSDTPLVEDAGDVVVYLNPYNYVEWASLGKVDTDVVKRVGAILSDIALDDTVRGFIRKRVIARIKKDTKIMQALRASGGQLIEKNQMNKNNTVGDADEFVIETADGELVVDASDLMEDVVIDALEQAIEEAIAKNPNQHLDLVRQVDSMLEDGDYESALHVGCALLRRLGVDESRLDEFKQGFKVSAGRRAAIARKRAKPKTGMAMMALRKRRRAAKKSSAKMKRARYYKRNRVRLARRRKQLANAIQMPDNTVVQEMLQAGMPFAILVEGADALFASSREAAEELAEEFGGAVVECTDLLEGRVNVVEAAADDEEDDEEDYADDEESDDEEDSEDDEEDDPDEEEPDDDEDDMEESVDENMAMANFAQVVARFIVANPKVTYGELATHFGIGRDVAQQFLLLHQFSSPKDRGSYLALAKEILGSMKTFQAGTKPLAASIEDDGANLSEAKKSATIHGNFVGKDTPADKEAMKLGASALARGFILKQLKMAASEGEFYDDVAAFKAAGRRLAADLEDADYYNRFHAVRESEEIDENGDVFTDDEPDPFSEPSKLRGPRGKKRPYRYKPKTNGKQTGVPKPGTKLPKVTFKGQDGAVKDDHADESTEHVDITVPRDRTEKLIAAAQAAGLQAESTAVRMSGGTLTLRVPAAVAAQIRQAVSA